MVKYTCLRCDKIYDHKGAYDRHLQRKKPCKKAHNNPDTEHKNADFTDLLDDMGTTCDYCTKEFTRKSDLKRHLNNGCKAKKTNDMQNILDKMVEQNEKMIMLEQEIISMKNKTGSKTVNSGVINNIENQHNTNNTHNTINNIQQNIIQINPFGHEVLNISDKQLKKCWRRCYNSVPELINYKHFNEDMPENSNVYIPNVKGTHAKIFTGERWEIRDANDIVRQIFEDNNDYLMEQFQEKEDELDDFTIRKFAHYVDKQDDDEVINNVKKDIKQTLYNKKHIPIKAASCAIINENKQKRVL